MITQRKREENKKWARDTLSHEMSAQHCINLASTSIVLIDLHLKWSLPLYRKCNVFIVVRFELSWDYCYVAWHNCSRIEFHIVTHNFSFCSFVNSGETEQENHENYVRKLAHIYCLSNIRISTITYEIINSA